MSSALALQRWDSVKKQALKGRSKDPYIVTTDRTEDLDLIKELITEFRESAEQEVSINKRTRESEEEERSLSTSEEPSGTNGVDGEENASHHGNGTGPDGGRDNENYSSTAGHPPSDRTVKIRTRPEPSSAWASSFESSYWMDKIERDLEMLTKLPERADKGVETGLFELFGGSRNMLNKKEAFAAFMQRLGMAIVGGVFLVVPMLIMVLHKGLFTSLLTTSLCVFAFG